MGKSVENERLELRGDYKLMVLWYLGAVNISASSIGNIRNMIYLHISSLLRIWPKKGYTFHPELNPPYIFRGLCNHFSLQLTSMVSCKYCIESTRLNQIRHQQKLIGMLSPQKRKRHKFAKLGQIQHFMSFEFYSLKLSDFMYGWRHRTQNFVITQISYSRHIGKKSLPVWLQIFRIFW